MWINLSEEQRVAVLKQAEVIHGLPAFVIEKDWWVCILLKAIFQSKYANSIIFKGGTSLSKAYNLIQRFSEDIDLIIDRRLLGFGELDSKTQIKKLRKASGGFIINEFREELIHQLTELGVDPSLYEIKYNDHVDDTSDPNRLEVFYQSCVPATNVYIQQRVLLELGARSLTEPAESKPIISYIDLEFSKSTFAMPAFNVEVVVPTRTLIEKILLLHEEFSKPIENIRTDRLTRHFYDIVKIMDSKFGELAIVDDNLFTSIVDHRQKVTPLRGIDYSNHKKGKLSILPPEEVFEKWEEDYKTMQEHMIIGDSLIWADLLNCLKEIENKFNEI